MVRSEHRDTHHTVSAGILEALGKGFLIATAGVVASLMFGTAPLESIGLWTVAVAAASGVACMIGSALVRNAGCDRCEEEPSGSVRESIVGKTVAAMPVVEPAGEVEPKERWVRRMVLTDRQHGTGTGRGG